MSVIANILVAPVVGISVLSGCLFLLLEDWTPVIAAPIGHICFLSLGYIDWIATSFVGLPRQFTIPEYSREVIGLGILGAIIGWSLRFLYPRGQPRKVCDLSRQ